MTLEIAKKDRRASDDDRKEPRTRSSGRDRDHDRRKHRSSSARRDDDRARKRSRSRDKAEKSGRRRRSDEDDDARAEPAAKPKEDGDRRADKRKRLEQFRSAIESEEQREAEKKAREVKQPSPVVADSNNRGTWNAAPDAAAEAQAKEAKEVDEQTRIAQAKDRAQAAEASRFTGFVLDLVRDMGLHARQNWQPGALSMATQKMNSLKQELFRFDEKQEFEERLMQFRSKKESGLQFLQFTLRVLQSTPCLDASSDAVLFLAMFIVCLQDRPQRISLHERLLTLKRQLQEGGIERKATDDTGADAPRQNISMSLPSARKRVPGV